MLWVNMVSSKQIYKIIQIQWANGNKESPASTHQDQPSINCFYFLLKEALWYSCFLIVSLYFCTYSLYVSELCWNLKLCGTDGFMVLGTLIVFSHYLPYKLYSQVNRKMNLASGLGSHSTYKFETCVKQIYNNLKQLLTINAL